MDIIDILLDESNRDRIVLFAENGKSYTFEQIAVIPKYDKLYCVLKPVDKISSIGDDEAVVFYVDDESDPPRLQVETDEKKAIEVFNDYYDLLEESLEEKGGESDE